jgi:DNA repair photolyase
VASVEVRELTSRSALNKVEGMPFKWSLNPYRGCQHDCHYCYARATHSYFDLGIGESFGRVILVKSNVPDLLRRELARSSWRHESVAIGTATDPYQPIEGTYRLTRRCLEVLADAGNPCTVTTKGTLALRDADVMQELSRSTDFCVYLSLMTVDADLCRRLEPASPPPRSRLRVLAALRSQGIPVHVLLMPIVPGLTDRPNQLEAVVRAAADHGATGVSSAVLRLAPGVKEWFVVHLRREQPGLVGSYSRGYAVGAEAPRTYRDKVQQRVSEATARVTFAPRRSPPPSPRIGSQYLLFAS